MSKIPAWVWLAGIIGAVHLLTVKSVAEALVVVDDEGSAETFGTPAASVPAAPDSLEVI